MFDVHAAQHSPTSKNFCACKKPQKEVYASEMLGHVRFCDQETLMDADEEEEEALVSASRYPVCDFPEDWSPLPLEGEEGPGQEEGKEGGDEEVQEPEEG